MKKSTIGYPLTVFLILVMLAGCGGGGSKPKPSPVPTATENPPIGVDVPNPIAEWRFEFFGENKSIPASVGSLDLTVGSTGTANDIFLLGTGIKQNAVIFNQPEPSGTVSNYYQVKSSAAGQELFNLRDAITIDLWVKFDRLASEQSNPVILVNRTSGGGYKLYLDNPANLLKFQINSTSATGSTVLAIGNWYHIVATYDKMALKIYLNGVLDGQAALAERIADVASANLKIGGESTGSAAKNFKGSLDDTRFYDQALTAQQVYARYTGTDYIGGSPTSDPDITPTATVTVAPTPSATATASPTPTEMPYGGNTHYVSNTTTWNTAMTNLCSGDIIIITSGSYTTNLTMKNKIAAPAHPVVIKAQNPQGTTLYSLEINNSDNIIIEDLKFGPSLAGTLLKIVNSKYIKIRKNVFDHKDVTKAQSSIITTQASDTIEIAYNSFLDKNYGAVSGSYIKTQYDAPNITTNMHIHHNYFKNIVPMPTTGNLGFVGDSDRETIVFGVSASQDIVTNHLVEYNLFEDCDGEDEIITVKTSQNNIRYNTFKNCLGSVTIRFGHYSQVYSNYFLGFGSSNDINSPNYETGGVRFYGSNHKLYNNYFQGLTGTGYRIPLLVDNGETTDSSGGDGHEIPTYCDIAFNTIIDCVWGIGVGRAHYPKTPRNCKISNNLVTGSKNSMFTGVITALNDVTNKFEGNIVWPTATATIGVIKLQNEVWSVNPQLTNVVANGYSLKVLGAASPAIDWGKGSYSYVVTDLGGESRGTSLDTGADEYSVAPVFVNNQPLTVFDVGPNAVGSSGFKGLSRKK